MNIKVNFDNIKVKETKKDFTVKILMLKGEKGEQGDLNPSHIVDNLTSTDNTKVLSAKQGKVLKDLVDKKPYYFDTVADMKAGNLNAGDMAITKGYYSSNDGGNGEYTIVDDNNLVDDGGSILELTNGLFAKLIIKNDIVNVKQFGAKGDGTTDDSTAIQKTIDYGKIVKFTDGNYLINTQLNLKSNTKLIGNKKATIKTNGLSNNYLLRGDGNYIATNIYKYIITGEEESKNFVLVDNNINYSFTIPGKYFVANNEVVIVPRFLNATVRTVNFSNNIEFEISLEVTENTNNMYNITASSTLSSNQLPNNYIENVEIDGINFENSNYSLNNKNLYAIGLFVCKNIKIKNCTAKNLCLFHSQINVNISASTSTDNYINFGMNTNMLNDNIVLENNVINGKQENDILEIQENTSAIYILYSKNILITNNNIKWTNNGISLWGGNVGGSYLSLKDSIKFCNNIVVTNNKIENVKNGGIWSSRAFNITVSNNYLDNGGDVGIDFEGTLNAVADGNVVNNFINGNLSVFFGSSDIIFSNNNCLTDKDDFNRLFYYAYTGSGHDFCTVKLIGNVFTSLKRDRYILLQGSYTNSNSDLYFENNTFNNVSIRSEQITNPILHIKNNKFYIDDNITIDENHKYFINLIPNNSRNIPQAYINGNLFKCRFEDATDSPINNSNFNDFYPIKFSGSRWRKDICLQIEENTFLGFSNIIYLNHQRGSSGNESKLFVYFKRNKTTGIIVNDSDAYGYVVFEDNKTISLDNTNILSLEHNYPNAIPMQDNYYVGTKIYFDSPDNDGYTGAICVTGGNPGTWKRFGKIES